MWHGLFTFVYAQIHTRTRIYSSRYQNVWRFNAKCEVMCESLKNNRNENETVRPKICIFNIDRERLKAKQNSTNNKIHRQLESELTRAILLVVVWMMYQTLRVLSHRYIYIVCGMCVMYCTYTIYTLMPNMIKNKFQLHEIRMIWYAKLNVVWVLGNGNGNSGISNCSISYDSRPNGTKH